MREEEIVAIPELAESGVTVYQLRAWMRRTRNVCPHFRLNGHTRRIPRALFIKWLAQNSKVERRS